LLEGTVDGREHGKKSVISSKQSHGDDLQANYFWCPNHQEGFKPEHQVKRRQFFLTFLPWLYEASLHLAVTRFDDVPTRIVLGGYRRHHWLVGRHPCDGFGETLGKIVVTISLWGCCEVIVESILQFSIFLMLEFSTAGRRLYS
jgi:hypothetical protein